MTTPENLLADLAKFHKRTAPQRRAAFDALAEEARMVQMLLVASGSPDDLEVGIQRLHAALHGHGISYSPAEFNALLTLGLEALLFGGPQVGSAH